MTDPTLRIAPSVKLGKNVRLICFANLYGCEIGDEAFVGPFVEIQSDVRVGRRAKIQSCSRMIGSRWRQTTTAR